MIKNIKALIDKNFIFFLIILVFVSYGQMLGMYVWQDDNALFFKLEHINEPAGYFGIGPIGNGLTKYAATPFIPIHYFFGTNQIAYFSFLLILYLVATLLVYKTFSGILGKTGGRIAGFLFGAGYVISDGVWRMANSATTSLSIIFLTVHLFSYHRFYKNRKIIWYLLALMFFFLASEITIVRTHYFFLIVACFEIVFFAFRKPPTSIIYSALRLSPFFYIFKNWALAASSSRTGDAQRFALGFINKEFNIYYGFLSTVANLVIPDWLTAYAITIQTKFDELTGMHGPILRLVLLIFPGVIIYLLLKKRPIAVVTIPLGLTLLLGWVIVSKNLFISQLVQPTLEQYFIASLGGAIFLIGLLLFFLLGKNRWIFLFLSVWMVTNIAVYSAYNPTFQYGTVERYMAHSFVALVGIFSLIFTRLPKSQLGSIGKIAIILLGVGNLTHALSYQNLILRERSFPAKKFYKDLKNLSPVVKKGDIFYFDIAANTQRYYNDAISTAMMPESTAIAWRYGIDRYDIKLTTDFGDFIKATKDDKATIENIHTFWYSKDGLEKTNDIVDIFLKGNKTSTLYTSNLPQTSTTRFLQETKDTKWEQPAIEIRLDKPIRSTIPQDIILEITAEPRIPDTKYPLIWLKANLKEAEKKIWETPELRSLSIAYQDEKESLLKTSKYSISSDWQHNTVENLHDQDRDSSWQSERTGWGREFTYIKTELPVTKEINRIVWINGFSHNTPTAYYIDTSIDGETWKTVREIENPQKIDNRELQVIDFTTQKVKFVRMIITKTLNGDSPVVAEFWPIPAKFGKLELSQAEKFVQEPLSILPSKEAFTSTLASLKNTGGARIFWKGNKTDSWQTAKSTETKIFYDGQTHEYKIRLPVGGTRIEALKIDEIDIPGHISVTKMTTTNTTISDF